MTLDEMNKECDRKEEIGNTICIAMWAIAIILGIALSSCKVQTPVVLPEQHDSIRTETADRSHYERDSIYVHDSVYVLVKGDTIHEHHWHTEYKEKAVADTIHDTLQVSVRDSIPYPVEVPKYIRQRNGYDRFTSWGFWILFGLTLLVIAFKIFRKYIKFKTGGLTSLLGK